MVPLEEKGFPYLEQPVQHPEDLSCRKVGSSRNRVGNVWVFPFIPPLIKGGLGGFSFPDLVKSERSLPSLHRVLVTPAS